MPNVTDSLITAVRTSHLTMVVLALIVSIIAIIAAVSIQSNSTASGTSRTDASHAAICAQKQRNTTRAFYVPVVDVGLDGMPRPPPRASRGNMTC